MVAVLRGDPVSSVEIDRDPTRPWAPSAFARLARVQGLSVAGDAIFTAAMAGTVFFSATSLDQARGRVAFTLLFTIAPFAVAAPLIGPLIDRSRGGRRWMIIAIAALRVVVCAMLVRHEDTWLLYPEGLLMLVLSKGHLIARGALVPTVVPNDDDLVKANAKLTLLSGIASAVAILPAVLLLKLGGPQWALGLGSVAFVACTVLAFDLPKTRVAAEPADAQEKAELRGMGILLAASSMASVRAIVGFLAFLVAFYAKDEDLPALIVAGAVGGQAGFLAGAVAAPRLREVLDEERIVMSCIATVFGFAATAALVSGDGASAAQAGLALAWVSIGVGFASNVAKQAFDAIVQRDAPDANRGRTFARFETRFQLLWVIGALVPTQIALPLRPAMLGIAGVAAFALVSYLVGRRRVEQGQDHRIFRFRRRRDDLFGNGPPPPPGGARRAAPPVEGGGVEGPERQPGPLPPPPVRSTAATAPARPSTRPPVVPRSAPPAPSTAAGVTTAAPPPVGHDAGPPHDGPVLFDGMAALEEDHPPVPEVTPAVRPPAGRADDRSAVLRLDAEPVWRNAVSPHLPGFEPGAAADADRDPANVVADDG